MNKSLKDTSMVYRYRLKDKKK